MKSFLLDDGGEVKDSKWMDLVRVQCTTVRYQNQFKVEQQKHPIESVMF